MLEFPGQEAYSGLSVFSLSELNAAIKESIEVSFPETLWVVAEISEAQCNPKGHFYMELVEKDEESIVAQIKANIWASAYRSLSRKFENATREKLRKGMKVLLQVNITFHEVYGLSLNVKDIDPTYSLGEMARKKRETLERLTKEGLINLNKQIPLTMVPQRIAVVSSVTAAGYGDFINHIEGNKYGYRIFHRLYQAVMQGEEAEASVISALRAIKQEIHAYDVVAVIRGGGSQADLSCFDAYGLAVEVAKFPLPVITGIGHERDDTVVDTVAHTKLKTPTAVAEFLITGMKHFEERVLEAEREIVRLAKELMKEKIHRFRFIVQNFKHVLGSRLHQENKTLEITMRSLIHGTTQALDAHRNRVKLTLSRIGVALKGLIQMQDNKIRHAEQAVRLLDPINVLKRGYSITYFKEKAVKDGHELKEGDIIKTRLHNGTVKSKVEDNDGEQ